MQTKETIELLVKHDLLRVVEEELDIYLEVPHVAYVEVKKENSKALLFTNVVDRKKGKKFSTPVLMNVFCCFKALELFMGDVTQIAKRIEELLHIKPPSGWFDKFSMFQKLFSLKSVVPKRSSKRGLCQEVIKQGTEAKLSDIPVLTTWEEDAAPFITMGQVYTQSLDGSIQNLGMYRLQVFDDHTLGVHWQIHKDSNHFFHEYKKAGKKMPVSIAIGGDPLYIWCGQAPLPLGVFELILYGFIRGKNPQLVKSLTNDLYIPRDVDYVIEGFVDVENLRIEGPFGDHTGYYTLEEPYPFMKVEAITHKKDPIYAATVVGKPPLEDKYMGYATERIFLPLLQTTVPDLLDYYMPENGVFHNLIIAKIKTLYPGHAQQVMHAFWGVGQMSFVKHAIFVGEDAPLLRDHEALIPYILNRIDLNDLFISKGVVDALDHSSGHFGVGGKLGIDCTKGEITASSVEIIDEHILLQKLREISHEVCDVAQYYTQTKTPLCVLAIRKERKQEEFFSSLQGLYKHFKLIFLVDYGKNSLEYPYMLLWRVVNNIDANRDLFFKEGVLCIDATNKNELDRFERRWPDDVKCSTRVLESLQARAIIDIDESFKRRFLL